MRKAPEIRTPDQRLRVFVSSTLGELAAERRAARDAIEQVRLTPVMFELGARPHPPRTLYRAYLEQSDVFVGIYWQRYGWVAPDMEISGLEDEYLLSRSMPRLVYVKEPAPDREAGLQRMLGELEGEDTASYKPFRDAEELRTLLADDLAIMLTERFVDVGRDSMPAPVAAPVPTTPLLGRDEDVRDVARLLVTEGRRLVTLTGPGGIGKTRLALAVMDSTRNSWTDGSVFVDLAPVRDPSSMLDVVASACGIAPEGSERSIDALARRLADRRLLLVLDNFEQVVAAAPGVGALLERCPGVSILVTSRILLRIRGERERVVAPLELAPAAADLSRIEQAAAVALFVQRVRDIRPSFELDASNAADVNELCRRLDGLPLALELAAARARLLTPRQILERIDARLEGPSFVDLPERQRTLAATLDWSYDLLDPIARAVLARLSVFAGTFTLTGAEQVCARDGIDIVEVLSTLVDHSLVTFAERPDGDAGFRLLDTVRAYANERLDEMHQTDDMFERLEAYVIDVYSSTAKQLHSRQQGAAMRRLDGEVENFFSVVRWSIDRGRSPGQLLAAVMRCWLFWRIRAHATRLPEVVAHLLATPDALDVMTPKDWVAVHVARAGGLFTATRFEEVLAFVPDAVALAEDLDERFIAGQLLTILGASRPYEAESPAHQDFERGLRLLTGDEELPAKGYLLAHLGPLLLNDGEVERAREVHKEALHIGETLGDENLIAEAHLELAHESIEMGELEDARERLRITADYYRKLEYLEGKSYCLAALAGLAIGQGEARFAARLLGAVAGTREPIDLRPWPQLGEIERRYAERTRAALTQDDFEEEFKAGRQMSPDEATAAGLAAGTRVVG
jgi:predicted ATPase